MLVRFGELILGCMGVIFIFICIAVFPFIISFIGLGILLVIAVYLIIEGIDYVLGEHK